MPECGKSWRKGWSKAWPRDESGESEGALGRVLEDAGICVYYLAVALQGLDGKVLKLKSIQALGHRV